MLNVVCSFLEVKVNITLAFFIFNLFCKSFCNFCSMYGNGLKPVHENKYKIIVKFHKCIKV